jgi:uncharacterized protein (DUF2141 family)
VEILKLMPNLGFIRCLFFFCLISFGCANRGTPTGGDKDETPPKIIKTIPKNFTTGFSSDEIEIFFDEYIKLKNLQKQLIISPPMDPQPEITPMGSASKRIRIRIFDTLQPNTTYSFNFGESIEDNNEGNSYPFFKYVFSTGNYIDSLSVEGNVKDALLKIPEDQISVILYEVSATFNDSVVYREKPKYIGVTDSLSNFRIGNVKEGKYLLLALKEQNSNYTYQQKTDKIAFRKQIITVPSDTAYVLNLFKEEIDFKFVRAKLIAQNKIAFGYEGSGDKMRIKLITETPQNFDYVITKEADKDSLNFWYKPNIETDSLVFEVSQSQFGLRDTVVIKKRKANPIDSLAFKISGSKILKLKDAFKLSSNTPIQNIDRSKIFIRDVDSVAIPFETNYDSLNMISIINFSKLENTQYNVEMLPGAFTDFYGVQNDTLSYKLNTKELSQYGNLRLNIRNATFPLLVQLVNANGAVAEARYLASAIPLDFNQVTPGKYFIRVIFDANANSVYDTGNYMLGQQPERVSYYPDEIEIRAGWDLIQEFILN